MKGSLYTLGYATVLGTVCALLLTGVGRWTAPGIEANEEAERVRHILGVLGVEVDEDASSQDLLAAYDEHVRREERGGLVFHVRKAGEGVRAVPFSGPGLWGPIKGFLALKPDLRRIHGVTFYEQEETPGLGGEIASADFRKRFEKRSIEDADGNAGIRIVRGEATAENEVHGITGATMTCQKVEAMLNEVIAKVVEVRGSNGG